MESQDAVIFPPYSIGLETQGSHLCLQALGNLSCNALPGNGFAYRHLPPSDRFATLWVGYYCVSRNYPIMLHCRRAPFYVFTYRRQKTKYLAHGDFEKSGKFFSVANCITFGSLASDNDLVDLRNGLLVGNVLSGPSVLIIEHPTVLILWLCSYPYLPRRIFI